MEKSTTIWDILEISQTNNKKEIKRAYSKKAKLVHPEDNPNEFMELRRAYEQALQYSLYSSYQEPQLSKTNENSILDQNHTCPIDSPKNDIENREKDSEEILFDFLIPIIDGNELHTYIENHIKLYFSSISDQHPSVINEFMNDKYFSEIMENYDLTMQLLTGVEKVLRNYPKVNVSVISPLINEISNNWNNNNVSLTILRLRLMEYKEKRNIPKGIKILFWLLVILIPLVTLMRMLPPRYGFLEHITSPSIEIPKNDEFFYEYPLVLDKFLNNSYFFRDVNKNRYFIKFASYGGMYILHADRYDSILSFNDYNQDYAIANIRVIDKVNNLFFYPIEMENRSVNYLLFLEDGSKNYIGILTELEFSQIWEMLSTTEGNKNDVINIVTPYVSTAEKNPYQFYDGELYRYVEEINCSRMKQSSGREICD